MNLLVSYAHIKKHKVWLPLLDMWAASGLPLMLDCGAFSVAMSGASIDHNAYLETVSRVASANPNVEYIQLDEIRNPVATRRNLDREYAMGFRSLPVHTNNALLSEYRELVENYNPRVCIAGGQHSEIGVFHKRVKACVESTTTPNHPHALGFTRRLEPLKNAAYSFDSSSWLAALAYGTIRFFDPIHGYRHVAYKDIVNKGFSDLTQNQKRTLAESGITVEDFRGPNAGRTAKSLISFITTDTWLRVAKRYEDSGKRFYFATVCPWMLMQLILTMKHQRRTGFDWKALQPEILPTFEALTTRGLDTALLGASLSVAKNKWDAIAPLNRV